MGLARINTHHWKAPLTEFTIEPIRHPPRLEDDTDDMLHLRAQSACENIRVGGFLERHQDVTTIIPQANRRCILRYVKANKITFHHSSPFSDAATMHRPRARMINYSE